MKHKGRLPDRDTKTNTAVMAPSHEAQAPLEHSQSAFAYPRTDRWWWWWWGAVVVAINLFWQVNSKQIYLCSSAHVHSLIHDHFLHPLSYSCPFKVQLFGFLWRLAFNSPAHRTHQLSEVWGVGVQTIRYAGRLHRWPSGYPGRDTCSFLTYRVSKC